MQDIVSMWYVEAWKLCVTVDSPVKIWSCMLPSKNCLVTIIWLLRYFWYHFGNTYDVKVLFWWWKIYKNIQFSFPNFIEKYGVPRDKLLWFEKSNSWMHFHVYSYQNLSCDLSSSVTEVHQQLITWLKLTELSLVDILIISPRKLSLFKLLYVPFFRWTIIQFLNFGFTCLHSYASI